jgi:hypothetical protein
MLLLWTNLLFAADSSRSIANGQLSNRQGRGGIPMESVTSNRIYLWSKILGAALLIAMAIVAAGNAQQFSAREKGKVNVSGPQSTILPTGRLRTIPPKPSS